MISQTILIRFHILPNLMVMRSSNENLNKGQEFADWEISIFCSTSEILMNILYFQYYKYILSVVIYFMSLDCESSRLMSSSRITTSTSQPQLFQLINRNCNWHLLWLTLDWQIFCFQSIPPSQDYPKVKKCKFLVHKNVTIISNFDKKPPLSITYILDFCTKVQSGVIGREE